MKLTIPELSFVVLIGVSGSGKSTFARKHFKPKVLSGKTRGAAFTPLQRSHFHPLHFFQERSDVEAA